MSISISLEFPLTLIELLQWLCSACGTSTKSGLVNVAGAAGSYDSLLAQFLQSANDALLQITAQTNNTIKSSFHNFTLVTVADLTQIEQSRNQTQSYNFNNTISQVVFTSVQILLLFNFSCCMGFINITVGGQIGFDPFPQWK